MKLFIKYFFTVGIYTIYTAFFLYFIISGEMIYLSQAIAKSLLERHNPYILLAVVLSLCVLIMMHLVMSEYYKKQESCSLKKEKKN